MLETDWSHRYFDFFEVSSFNFKHETIYKVYAPDSPDKISRRRQEQKNSQT